MAETMIEQLFSVKGKVALVTGGSRGIGRHIARGLLEGGASRVYITARKAEACDKAAAELQQYGECISLPSDIATAGARRELVEELTRRESALHVLVNNAGATWGAPIDEYPEDGFDKVMDLNVKTVFLLTQALLPQLRSAARKDDPARVVNLGSIDGLAIPGNENYAYSASKAAVHHLTRHLAAALAVDGITVNAIAPGLFQSRMTDFIWKSGAADTVIQNIPLGREGGYEDAAGAALYLASRAGAWVTGAVIPVSGGTVSATPQLRRQRPAAD